MKKKRVLITADTHCGHRAGLTPRQFQQRTSKWYDQQRIMWNWYITELKKLGKIDVHIHNGDAIDGKGERSGGTEIFEADRHGQAKIAAECLKVSKAKKYYLLRGTPYHNGSSEDFEDVLGIELNAEKVANHLFLTVNKTVFDVKHTINSSGLPHTRHNALGQTQLWNLFWADRKGQEKADIIIRSHVHYFDYAGNSRYLGIITPCLQGFGSKYGEKKCQGIIDIGFVFVDVFSNGTYEWQYRLMEYETINNNGITVARLK